MAQDEHLRILASGVPSWNLWRQRNRDIRPDPRAADLKSQNLDAANLTDADPRYAHMYSGPQKLDRVVS